MSDMDLTVAQANFKIRYADKIKDNVPAFAWIMKNADKLIKTKKIGLNYTQPVKLASGQGYKFSATGIYAAVSNYVALNIQSAVVSSYEILRADRIPLGAIKRSEGKPAAFTPIVDLTMEDMAVGHYTKLEIVNLYGGTGGIGEASARTNTDSTHTVLTFTAASFAGGIWASQINAEVQFYDAAADTTLVSSGDDSIFSVDSVDSANYKVTFSGTATGISALDTAVNSANQYCYFNGAKGVEGSGLKVIASNTGSLFGINAATAGNSLWAGNTYSASSGPLTFAKVQKAAAVAADKGLVDEDTVLLVSSPSWADLVTSQAAARRYVDVKEKFKNGARGIEFASAAGDIRIVAHPCVKRGDAFLFPKSALALVGSTDVTYNALGDDLFIRISGSNSFEAASYSDLTLFSDVPSKMVYINNIVPNA